jgi:N-acyl-L-homoserine lactone synthetase
MLFREPGFISLFADEMQHFRDACTGTKSAEISRLVIDPTLNRRERRDVFVQLVTSLLTLREATDTEVVVAVTMRHVLQLIRSLGLNMSFEVDHQSMDNGAIAGAVGIVVDLRQNNGN